MVSEILTIVFSFFIPLVIPFVLDARNGSVLIDLVHFISYLFVYLEIMLNFAAD